MNYDGRNYYPFGMLMSGRTFSSQNYRFGFDGKQNDNEVKGTGNSVDFGDRMNDVRLGRWESPDKLAYLYPAISPYVSVLDNPIIHVDTKGDSVELIIGRPYTDENGKEHPYGHAALRVFNAKEGYDVVYDFGRYGQTWVMGSEGEGILNVYESSKPYLADEQRLRSSVGYVQPTTVGQDKEVMAFFQQKIDAGEVFVDQYGNVGLVPGGGGTSYKLAEDYHYNNNNCMTLSCAGLNVIGMDWLNAENRPNDAFEEMESSYQALRLKRISYPQGEEAIVTWTPPTVDTSALEFDFTMPTLSMPQDNTRVARPNLQMLKQTEQQ